MSAEGVENSLPRTGVPRRWVAELPPEASAVELAQAVLDVRLKAVESYLADAEHLRRGRRDHAAAEAPPSTVEGGAAPPATPAEGAAETIHHLRVATRRAGAALAVFRRWLPKKGREAWGERLRTIRGAAGMARNCDVLEERWLREAGEAPGVEWSLPLQWLGATRDAAQEEVLTLVRKLRRGKSEQRIAKLVDAVRWRGKGPAPEGRQWAVRQLQEIAAAFREQSAPPPSTGAELSPKAQRAAENEAVERLHRRRIAAKRLRYALEVFAPVLPPAECEELYALVEQVQERLGALNDHATAAALIVDWLEDASRKRDRRHLKARLSHERAEVQVQQAAFQTWWSGVGGRFHDRLDTLAEAEAPAPYRVVAS